MAGDISIYYGHTVAHPLALLLVAILCVCVLVVNRSHIIVFFIAAAVLISPAQRISIAGVDFTFLRILICFTCMRILLRNESACLKPISLDRAVLFWAAAATVAFTIQQGSLAGMVNRLGYMMDSVAVYFAFRCIIRSRKDVDSFIDSCILFSVPVLVFFIVEYRTGYNVFSLLGGVPAFTIVREGRLRVQGAFAHPILAGVFWAAVFPLIVGRLVWERRGKPSNSAALLIHMLLIYLTASSTPVLGVTTGIAVLLMFKMRRCFKALPILSLLLYAFLDVFMSAPVWHLLARIDISGGSTGWHRFWLIDQTIRHFTQWIWVGTVSIDSWNVHGNDITNQYVQEAIRGGLITLSAFVWMVFVSLRTAFRGAEESATSGDASTACVAWALGASMAVHAVSFIGVSYFGQILMLQYITMAMIGSMYQREAQGVLT